jgi:predicted metal-dependent hydrolase
MNHSKRFWNEVKIMSENIWLGDYNIRRKWIRENGKSMSYV